jgi:hypothetical protein
LLFGRDLCLDFRHFWKLEFVRLNDFCSAVHGLPAEKLIGPIRIPFVVLGSLPALYMKKTSICNAF